MRSRNIRRTDNRCVCWRPNSSPHRESHRTGILKTPRIVWAAKPVPPTAFDPPIALSGVLAAPRLTYSMETVGAEQTSARDISR
jgi:hypothetical protein